MLIVLFDPGHNVASYNMNRQVGILTKKLSVISLLFNVRFQKIIELGLLPHCDTVNKIRLCNNKQYSLVSLSGVVETLRLQAKKSFTLSRRDIITIIPHLKTTGLS